MDAGVVQLLLARLVEANLLQCFFTGLYALVFIQAIVPLVQGKKFYLSSLLIAEFICIIVNLVANCNQTRDLLTMTPQSKQEELALAIMVNPHIQLVMERVSLVLTIIMADVLLVWRCYVLWENNRWILIVYSPILLAQIAFIPFDNLLHIEGVMNLAFIILYYAISTVVTCASTGLIIYRILSKSKGISLIRTGPNPYRSIIEVLVESGTLYTFSAIVSGVFNLLQVVGVRPSWVVRVSEDLNCIMAPITGIAPALIIQRISASRSTPIQTRMPSDQRAPISTLMFRVQDTERGGVQSAATASKS